MIKATISLIAEPAYNSTHWFTSTIAGIYGEAARKGLSVAMADPCVAFEAADKLRLEFPDGLAMVVGTSISWVNNVSLHLQKAGIRCVLLGSDAQKAGQNISVVNLSHESSCMDIVQYLVQAGRKRIAFFAANSESISDKSKLAGYFAASAAFGLPASEGSVFYNSGSVLECAEKFRPFAADYDGVICSNDVAAIALIRASGSFGLSIPEDLYVVGFGDTYIGRLVKPSLTTATLNYYEVGCRAVESYLYLRKNPSIISQFTVVACQIIVRESTQYKPAPGRIFLDTARERPAPIDNLFYSDPHVKGLLRLEEFFQRIDDIDGRILEGLAGNTTYEELAEQLSISESTVKYRLKKILQIVNAASRQQLQREIGNLLGEGALEVFNSTVKSQRA